MPEGFGIKGDALARGSSTRSIVCRTLVVMCYLPSVCAPGRAGTARLYRIGATMQRRLGPPGSCRPPRTRRRATRRARGLDRARADRRQIGAPVLAGFHQLDQDPAGPRATQAGGAGEHRVGALDGLDGRARSLLAPRSPGPTSTAPSARHHVIGAGDVGSRLCVRRRHRSAGRAGPTRLGQHLVRADHPEPLVAQHPHDGGQQPSSPAKAARPMRARMRAPSASGRRSSKSRGAAPGRPARGPGTRCARSKARIRPAAPRRANSCGKRRQHRRLGVALERHEEHRAPGRPRGCGDAAGKRTAAGDDAERPDIRRRVRAGHAAWSSSCA